MSSDITPEIAERVKAEVLTMQTLDDLWVLATDYADLLDRAEKVEADLAAMTKAHDTVCGILAQAAKALAGKAGEETMAWAAIGPDGKVEAEAVHFHREIVDRDLRDGERIVRVAIRVVEGGDDAA